MSRSRALDRLVLGSAAGICAALGTVPARADASVAYQRAAVGAVAHEYDPGGLYLRAEYAQRDDVAGMALGVSVWRGEHADWGVGVPLALQLVALDEPVHFGLGGGFDLVHFDELEGRSGVGLFAPLALIELELPLGPVWLGAEARLEYRWKSFGTAYEQAQLALGLTFAIPLEGE